MPSVTHYTDSQAAVITLNKSEEGNRLDLETLEHLSSTFNKSSLDNNVRVILLRSNGNTFCTGMDLVQLQNLKAGMDRAEKALSLYVDLLSAIYNSPKPVICLVNGDVKAGGVGLMSACDIIIASNDSNFELSEVLFGLIPANVLPYLFSLRITPQKARYLILSSKRISAAEAHRLNLVDEIFPRHELEKAVRTVIKRLFRSSPGALAETKAFTKMLLGKELDTARELAKEKLLELIKRPEVIHAVTAFNEGSVPDWFGRYRPQKEIVPGVET